MHVGQVKVAPQLVGAAPAPAPTPHTSLLYQLRSQRLRAKSKLEAGKGGGGLQDDDDDDDDDGHKAATFFGCSLAPICDSISISISILHSPGSFTLWLFCCRCKGVLQFNWQRRSSQKASARGLGCGCGCGSI
ncbi:hypothetical protein ACLKA6_013421 [Drosophila palustris]